ncbi:MAG: AAA family ATPase, partial [Campylobacterota bacterium]|nr:AAA family ATPase [Campylobacterota bacterium]
MGRRRYTNESYEEFNKAEYVEKELQDKITLWMLRIIVKLGGHKKFIDKYNNFDRDEIGYFLEVGKYVHMDSEDFKKSEPMAILKKNYIKFEKRKRFTTSKILAKNIKNISKLMNLNCYEEQILEFVILINQYDILDHTADLFGSALNSSQAKKLLSSILDIPIKYVNNAFCSKSKFIKSSIITINKNNTNDLRQKLDIISEEFADNMLNLDEDISVMIKDSVRPCSRSDLNIKDYTHISKEINILVPYLKNACESKQNGVNILLYGLPGTGKTELAKTIANTLKTELFEISYANEYDEPIDGKKRLKAYKTAQALLSNHGASGIHTCKNTILMYDEAEDIFDSNDSPFATKRQTDKAWINRILETNTIPTIWITNNIHSIDNALVRRFDMSIEVPIPKKSQREEIIKKYSKNLLDAKSIKTLSQHEDIAPALISRTAKVVSSIETTDKNEAFKQVLNNTLKAQGYNEVKENSTRELPNTYNPNFINTTTNLEELTLGIKETANARLCLYGAAGTGKSAFGKYIADTLDKTVILKKASDLQSMWVGE